MNATGTLHVSCAAIALATGGYVIATVKGTRRHRWVGRTYAIAMLCLNGSALFIYHLTGHIGPFHYLALVSGVTVVLGLTPVLQRPRRTGWRVRHAMLMLWSYIGLVAALAAEIIVRVPAFRDAGQRPGTRFVVSVVAATLVVTAVGGLLAQRYRRQLV